MASITIVANTGFFRLTLVNHMAAQRTARDAGADAADTAAVPSRSRPIRPAITGVPAGPPRAQRHAQPLGAPRIEHALHEDALAQRRAGGLVHAQIDRHGAAAGLGAGVDTHHG